jgi:hypothetical protein
MAYLFVILVVFCFWHFVYEAILLPTLRLKLRFQLYALRDAIRDLKIDQNHRFNDVEFNHMHSIINSMLQILPILDLRFVRRMVREEIKNPDLNSIIEQRRQMIESCSVGRVREIYNELSTWMNYAVLANSFGLLMYLMPVFLIRLLERKRWEMIDVIRENIEWIDPEKAMRKT